MDTKLNKLQDAHNVNVNVIMIIAMADTVNLKPSYDDLVKSLKACQEVMQQYIYKT